MIGEYTKSVLLIIGLFFCLHLNVNGQQPFIRKYLADEYQGGQNWQMQQDKDGILYVANGDGVLRFDGTEWSSIRLPNQEAIHCLAIDSTGRIYVGGNSDVGYLQKEQSDHYTYHSLLPLLALQNKTVTSVSQIILHGREVLFRDSENMYSYSEGKIRIINVPLNFFLIRVDNHIYILVDNKVYIYKDFNFELTDFPVIKGIGIKFMTGYTKGKFLILDTKDKLWVFDPTAVTKAEQLKLITNKISSYVNGAFAFYIKLLDNGFIAIATHGNIIFINQHGQLISHIEPDVLKYIFVNDFFEDDKHNFWVSGNREILQINTSLPLAYYNENNGIHHKIISLTETDDFQYLGTGWGIYYMEKGKTQCMVVPSVNGVTWNLYNFSGKVYAAHQDGVWEVRGKKATHLIKDVDVMTLCRLKRHPDRMILGTYNTGIWLTTKNGTDWVKRKIMGFEDQARYMEEDDEGNIWIAHYNKGIYRLRLNESMDSVIEKSFFDKANGLPSNINNRIYSFKFSNKLVATTVNGVYTFNSITNRFEPDKNINTALGQNFCIYTIIENAIGDLYFWGGLPNGKETAGLLKKRKDGSFELILTPFNKITIAIKNQRVDVDAPILAAEDGNILFGNDLRLISYCPDQKTFYKDPVPVAIRQAYAGDSLIFNSRNQKSVSELPFALNNVKFEVASYIFEDPEKTEYQYRMEGFDDHWSDWTHSREASYTNLSNGNYTFFVRAKTQYGKISSSVGFTFQIKPPWYKTIGAYLAYFVFTVAFISLIVKIYTWRVNEQKLKLQRIVSEQNKELLTQNEELLAVNEELSAINDEVHVKNKAISEQAKQLEKLNVTKDKLFSIISHDLRGPVIQVQNIFDLVDSNYMSEEELKAMIPRLKENIRQTSNLTENLLYWARTQMDGMQVKPRVFDLRMIVDDNLNLFKPIAANKGISLISQVDTSLSVYADNDMMRLVLRNLLGNAVKFTNSGGKIIIGYERLEKFTMITVEDTGIGLTDDEISKLFGYEHFTKYGTSGEKGAGIGFSLCREFTEKNGGLITLESVLDKGSKFSFTAPNNSLVITS
jgi:signal transduction histidine kinase/ligand-binding sensor domain-containing protein